MSVSAPPRLLRLPQVIELTGLGRDSVYRLMRQGKFPRQRRLSERASAWRSDEVAAWIESRPPASVIGTP
jgi:prophage regulatory protein